MQLSLSEYSLHYRSDTIKFYPTIEHIVVMMMEYQRLKRPTKSCCLCHYSSVTSISLSK